MKTLSLKILLLILASVVTVAVVGTSIFLIVRNLDKPDDGGGGVGMTIDKNAGEFVPHSGEQTKLPNVVFPGWGKMTIPPNTTDLKNMVDFFNPAKNADYYYLTFELRLITEEGYEVLYQSDLVEAGKHIQSIKISHGLPVGEYDAVVHIQPYLITDLNRVLNCADVKLKLIVI